MNRDVITDLHTILSLVSCALDYGFEILVDTFADMIGRTLTADEISDYVQESCLSESARAQGYNEKDAQKARELLVEFQRRYCNEQDD